VTLSIDDKPHKFVSYSLKEAWYRFGDSQLLEKWEDAAEETRRIRHPGIEDSYLPDRVKRRRRVALEKPGSNQLARKIHNGIKRNLSNGYLTAWGREGRPTSDWVQIPVDAWNYLSLNFRQGVATVKNGDTYFSVRISRSVILNDRWENGLTLQDAEELLAGYEKLNAVSTDAPEYSGGFVEGSAVASAWQYIENSVFQSKDLFMWLKSPTTHSWVKLADAFDGIIPIIKFVDLEASTISASSITAPVPCLISNVCALPTDGFTDFNTKKLGLNKIFTTRDIENAYKEYVAEWPPRKPFPSREEDAKWGKEIYGLGRERMRILRKKFAPESWAKRGPKSRRK
jgi:hypothetical protein